jgi:hypothetical protein
MLHRITLRHRLGLSQTHRQPMILLAGTRQSLSNSMTQACIDRQQDHRTQLGQLFCWRGAETGLVGRNASQQY